MAIGRITIDAQGNTQHDGYWPFGAFSQSLFNRGSQDYAFGTPSRLFAVDTGSGTILALPKTASKSFDPTYAGT